MRGDDFRGGGAGRGAGGGYGTTEQAQVEFKVRCLGRYVSPAFGARMHAQDVTAVM